MTELYEKNGTEAREFVATATTIEQLRTLLLEEKQHPKFDSGRSGVISAIENRMDEVRTETQKEEQEKRRSEAAKQPPPPRVSYKIVVPNVSDDRGDPIAKGTPCSIGAPPPGGIHLSPDKFRYYQRIGAIEEVVE